MPRTPISASTSLRTSELTSSTLWVTRTAPSVRPALTTGTAVKSRSSSSESLWRSPCVGITAQRVGDLGAARRTRRPRALAGRVGEQAPAPPTTITRPPDLVRRVRRQAPSWARSSSRPDANAARSWAWPLASLRTSASTRRDRLRASGTSRATITSTST